MTSAGTVADLGEDGVVALLRDAFAAPRGAVGIGDDAAVFDAPAHKAVLCTDTMVEGIDFDLAYTNGSDLGWKAVAINVSDLAAMGADPGEAVATMCLPTSTEVALLDGVIDGIAAAAEEWGVRVVGGDLSSAPVIVLGIALLGSVERAVLRSGAHPGDAICVTGHLGGSAGGLAELRADPAAEGPLVERHLRPLARLEQGRALATAGVSAMIDVSDGCVLDLARLLQASGAGCRVETTAIPIDPALEGSLVDPLQAAMFGGEDFELLFTTPDATVQDVRDRLSALGTPVTQIGVVTDGPRLIDGRDVDLLKEEAWDHLRSR